MTPGELRLALEEHSRQTGPYRGDVHQCDGDCMDAIVKCVPDTTIGPISHTPGEHIECWCKQCELTIFLAARLVNIHGESRNLDYVRAAERITGQKIEAR